MGLNVGPQQWWLDRYGPPQRSLRFNSSDSAYLSRTPSTAGNRKTWTWAGWVKRSVISSNYLLSAGPDVNNSTNLLFNGNHGLSLHIYSGGSFVTRLDTTQVFRDPSSWYHIVAAFDSDDATSGDRAKLYVNGIRIADFATSTYPSSGLVTDVNNTANHFIGKSSLSSYFNGYLADCFLIDGQALDPTSFGEFDTNGIWQPITYTGTYGTNGFHLPFSDNSTAAALGTDTSGNGNDWTVNNISVVSANYNGTLTAIASGETVGSPENAFDNNLSTTISGVFGGIKFTPLGGSQSNVTSLRFYSKSFGQGGTIKLNGTTIESNYDFGSGGWYSFSSAALSNISNTLTSFEWDRQPGAGGNTNDYLIAVEINGTVLVNSDNDSLVDVPTNGSETDTGVGGEVRGNYCTLNPLINGGLTLSNGNLDFTSDVSNRDTCVATHGVSSGKWYWEYTVSSNNYSTAVGIEPAGFYPAADDRTGDDSAGYSWWLDRQQKWHNGSSGSYGASVSSNAVIGVALDLDGGSLTFYLNGSTQGAAYTGISGTYLPSVCDCANGSTGGASGIGAGSMNFGQRPFAYTAPSGFKALCTANLPAPVVTKPSEYMDVVTYTGNGGTQTISGLGFSPDFVWIKNRGVARDHRLFDAVRGAQKQIYSSDTAAEATDSTSLTSFNSDGFALGSSVGVNESSQGFVAWTWDAGSSTVTNTDGSITSSVRANPSAGFSIVTYTGTGSLATVGHGLGAVPRFLIIKNRTQSGSAWAVQWNGTGTNYIQLSDTGAANSSGASSAWNNTNPTSALFTINTKASVNANSANYVAYCFAPVDGYGNGFSYTGNGNADGPFQYLGFLPKLILIKCSSTTGNWVLLDTERGGYNVDNDPLFPNLSNAEATTDLLDITSNGFKLRSTNADVNANAATYIGYAWAESPFQFSRAR